MWTLEKSVGDKITYNDEGKTATAAYLHHEPGVTAQFVFHQDQTDTYSAFDEEYEMTIMPKPAPMLINSSKYNEYKNY